MSAEPDFSQIHSYLLKILPELLRQPEIVTIIKDIIAKQEPRHDEFTQVLNEIKLLREKTQRQIEQSEKHLEQQHK